MLCLSRLLLIKFLDHHAGKGTGSQLLKIMNYKLISTACILILGLTLTVQKAVTMEVDDLYYSDILVSSRSENDRTVAIIKGLQRVFVKVSGNSKVLQHGLVIDQMQHAGVLLQQYEYKLQVNDAKEEQVWIHLEFDAQGVNRLLKQANQPIWGSNRPFVIAWMINNDKQSSPQAITDTKLQQLLARNLNQRGIPFIQPIFDLQELDQLDHLKRGYADWDRLQKISKRYGSDVTLLIKLTQMGEDNWQSQWSVLLGTHAQNWELKGSHLDALFRQGVDLLGDSLAQQYYQQVDQDNKSVTLIIDNIDSSPNYSKMNQYLRSLSTIEQFKVVSVYEDTITYELVIDDSGQSLVRIFALSPLLVPVDNGFNYSNILHYRMAL